MTYRELTPAPATPVERPSQRLLGRWALALCILLLAGGAWAAPKGKKDATPPEADWRVLSKIKPGEKKPGKEIQAFLGKPVKVGGFIVNNETDPSDMSEFLLSAIGQACVHVPPPPPNYVIQVKMAGGKKTKPIFGPVLVHGTIQISTKPMTAYEMSATFVEPYPIPAAEKK